MRGGKSGWAGLPARGPLSVAFRRESDDEHRAPKFEIPLPPGPNIVTARGLALIAAQVAHWHEIVAAATDDDARQTAKRDLAYWSTRLATARLCAPPVEAVVGIGARVTFRLNGKERTIEIVGHDEAEPGAGRIAFSAPLAKAMISAGVGDTADFGGVGEAIVILAVSATPAHIAPR